MVEIACQCEAGLGLPHSHVLEWGLQIGDEFIPCTIEEAQEHYRDRGVWQSRRIADQVLIWVDWEKVAKALMTA